MLRKKKYFTTIKRGEIPEWKKELSSRKENTRKEAVKKIVAAMTCGKDVGMLFTDVINCSQTNNVELKKLVYLYMTTYAPQNSELAILAVSSLVKDISHKNSLIRGLALRTMSSLGVDELLEYLTGPLKKCLIDDDPYVRKIASLAVAKFFLRSPSQALENGLVEDLEKLLRDGNSMVVSNTVIALCEIVRHSKEIELKFTKKTIKTILLALPLSNEWGQVCLMDCLSTYVPTNKDECDMIIDKILPRLQHSNPSVIMSSIKVLMNLWDHKGKYTSSQLKSKIKQPFLTLIGIKNVPEIQYSVLKNIHIILDRFKNLLKPKEVKYFFCNYDDPLYVKLQKLKIISRLVTPKTIDIILLELRDYVNSIDIMFVKAAIQTIGDCALKTEGSVSRCIPILVDIVNTKVHYAVQESICVFVNILRNFPKKFTKVIKIIGENLNVLEDNNAKCAMIWIISEHFDVMENADDVLQLFLNHFKEQTETVQLQLLNTCVKVYLNHPNEKIKEILETLLSTATEDCDNPDLRDKSYFYFRMISKKIAKKIVLKKLPPMKIEEDKKIGKMLLNNLTTVASIIQKSPEVFVPNYQKIVISAKEEKKKSSKDDEYDDDDEDEDDDVEEEGEKKKKKKKKKNLVDDGAKSPSRKRTGSFYVLPLKETKEIIKEEEKRRSIKLEEEMKKKENKVLVENLLNFN